MLSVQDSAGALEQVKAIFSPYVEGFAQLVQQQVMLMSLDCLLTFYTQYKRSKRTVGVVFLR